MNGEQKTRPAQVVTAAQQDQSGRGRSMALTVFALALGALALLPLWNARLPDGRLLVRIVSLPVVVLMIVVLAGLADAEFLGYSVGPPGRHRRVVTRTRLLLAWYVLAGVLLTSDLPLVLNVVISRTALEARVRAVQSGRPGTVPDRLGGFPVIGVSSGYPGPGKTSFDLPGGSQLVYSETADGTPQEYLHHIIGRWSWYRWEGA